MTKAIELVPYRPLGSNERYCPACGADTLQRAPDGTEYFGGHGEADCYRRRLAFALAELQDARAEAEALRERIEALEEFVRAEKALRDHAATCNYYDWKPGACPDGACKRLMAARDKAYRQALAVIRIADGGATDV